MHCRHAVGPSQTRRWALATTAHNKRNWRVAVVTETYPPEVNGVALTVEKLVQGLLARGHSVELIRPRQAHELGTPRSEAGLSHTLTRGLPIPQYPQLRLGLPARWRLTAQWQRQRPDIVHVATEGPLGSSAISAAKALGIAVSSDFRTNFHTYSAHYGVGWLMPLVRAHLRRVHNRADFTMVPNEGLRQSLSGQGFKRLLVVGRGVDSEQFSPQRRSEALRAQWGVQVDQPVILSVGRLAAEKNFSLLAKAWAAMHAANPRLRLVIVGDGPMRDAVRRMFPDAIMAGMRRGADLAAHYASADGFVFPSTTETYGNVVPEAMASGLATVAYDYAAAAEWIQSGVNGCTAPMNDEAAFVQACVQAWADGQASAWRAAARQTALQRDWSSIVSQVEAHWRHLLAQESASHGPFAVFHSG